MNSINLLINSTKLNWCPDSLNRREGMDSEAAAAVKICPWCMAVISGNIAVHLIKYCGKVQRPESTDFKKNI